MHKTKKRMLLWIAVCANDVIRMSSVTCGVAVTWAEMQHGLSMAQVSITIKHHKNLDSKSLSSINTIFSTPTIFQKTPCSNRMEWTGRPANVIIELQTVCKEWSWNPKSLRCAAALAGHPSAVLSTETNVCVILSAEHMSPTAKPLPPQILDSNCTVQQLSCLTTTASHFVVVTVSQCALETNLLGLHLQVLHIREICEMFYYNLWCSPDPCQVQKLSMHPPPAFSRSIKNLKAIACTSRHQLYTPSIQIVLSVSRPYKCLLLQINRKFIVISTQANGPALELRWQAAQISLGGHALLLQTRYVWCSPQAQCNCGRPQTHNCSLRKEMDGNW